MTTNCPNCGAPITDLVCEYCGTRHYDLPTETYLLHLNKQITMEQTRLSQAAQANYLLQHLHKWIYPSRKETLQGEIGANTWAALLNL